MHNWVEKLDLICMPGWKVGLLGSSLFFGWVLTLLWVPGLSDKYGRKKFMFWGILAQALTFTAIMVSKSFWLTVFCIGMFGALSSVRINIGFNYFLELVGAPYRNVYGTIWNISEGVIYLYATIYFWQIDTHWFYFVAIGWLLNWIAVVGIYFLPESPVFLLKKGRIMEAYESLKYIAKVNGR